MSAPTRDARVFVAGHGGLAGSAIVRALRSHGFENLVLATRDELDLRDGRAVRSFFERERPELVYLAAARVGGIVANDRFPADFLSDNLAIELNVISAAFEYGVEKLLFLGSSCVYPKHAPQPMREEHLLTGPLEPTNEWYAVAKIAGIKLCQAHAKQHGARFICAMPTNLYGPGDNFSREASHVLPALIRRFHEAKEEGRPSVTIWGSGSPRREFMHADDLADACLFLMERYESPDIVNVGVGADISILELADLVRGVVGFVGKVETDRSKPDGAPRKLLDVSRLSALGWRPRVPLKRGIEETYRWFRDNVSSGTVRL